MIEVKNLTKRFGSFRAVDSITFTVPDGCVLGLVGVNGAGKSTLLRMMTGIYLPEEGEVLYDGVPVYDNPDVKDKITLVPDELYLPDRSCFKDMVKRYAVLFRNFDAGMANELCTALGLSPDARFNTFSKGMKRQAATALSLARGTQYIFFDETFDGLDPFKRADLKRIIRKNAEEKGITAIITSHSLRELEDTCDQLALLDRGGLVFESDAEKLRTSHAKIQVAFSEPFGKEKFDGLDLLSYAQHGSVANLIVGGDTEAAMSALSEMNPLLLEILPLTLEEVFTFEASGSNAADGKSKEEVILKTLEELETEGGESNETHENQAGNA